MLPMKSLLQIWLLERLIGKKDVQSFCKITLYNVAPQLSSTSNLFNLFSSLIQTDPSIGFNSNILFSVFGNEFFDQYVNKLVITNYIVTHRVHLLQIIHGMALRIKGKFTFITILRCTLLIDGLIVHPYFLDFLLYISRSFLFFCLL